MSTVGRTSPARGEVRCERLGSEKQVMLYPHCPVCIAWMLHVL